MTNNLLQQLRDIHYPPRVSMWPLAWGWYLLFAVIIIALLGISYFWYKYYRKHRIKRLVLQRLALLQTQCELSNSKVAEELSTLLKRAVLAKYSRYQVAGLHGEQWLEFLDKTTATNEFTKGCGRMLIVTPYAGKEEVLPPSLFILIRNWVIKNL
jgi:hypothetical protein